MKTHLDLFSGIGGFALAAGWAGFNTIGFCEVEDYPRRILSKRFPGVRLHGDIRELDGSDFQGVTLITGGYPCQPFSQAGKRKGAADDRHLWPEMLRIVKQARPAWVLAENVAGHITMGLDQVLADLEGEGYAARAVVVPACAVNAPHRRDRVWIVAKQLHDADTDDSRRPKQERQHEWPEDLGGCSEDKLESRSVLVYGYERIGPSYWETEPAVGRVADGVPNRVDRLKALGNAIVPQVAYELIRHLETHG